MRRPQLSVILFLLFSFVFFGWQFVRADCQSFSHLIENGSYAVADHTGKILSSCSKDTSYIPASIVKIPLALAAFDILGRDFRFVTEFFMDQKQNLFIRGYGDPYLISQEIELIFDELIKRGVRVINGIYIDSSAYNLDKQVPGRGTSNNPYDVPVSPVTVNFNTVNINVLADGSVTSAEPQTPTLQIMQETGKNMLPGTYRLNVCQGDCSPAKQSARYTAELFRSLQRKKGIAGDGPEGMAKVPQEATSVYVHQNSRTLEEVVYSFLKYSNNLIANQVFLRCGIEKFDAPATWEKGRKAIDETLSKLLGPQVALQVSMEEGAGLSRKNRITASAMVEVLKIFKPYANLMQKKQDTTLKSGTLEGVYNYAGYLHGTMPFVILLNQRRNNRDTIMEEIKRTIERKEKHAGVE